MNATKAKECAALRERKTVFDEITNERDRRPLSLEQLRERLKHIAGLCWGLSIDLNNEVTRNEELTAENKRLQNEIDGLRAELKLVRNRENARGFYRQKTSATTETQGATPPTAPPKPKKERKRKPDEELTPEELRKRNQHREWNARYYAKKRAEQSQGGNND